MKNYNTIKATLKIGTILLIIFSTSAPMVLGFDIFNHTKETMHNSDGPPMDSPWPMYCHDVRHTGRSPYNIADNPGFEKWRFDIDTCWGSPAIDEDGIIYIGADDFFAIYPNGTLKWKYEIPGIVRAAPAIDENGTIYVGSYWGDPDYMYAFYPDGKLKWKFKVGDWIYSSPAIGEDGSIYFGSEDDYIYALYPNGTLKWKYLTDVAVYSDPAIGQDGTVYCGSHDGFLYALYANNGTLKWKYKTGDWVARGPCIADDGTIYFDSWDGHLYACYPNGTLKWKKEVDFGTTPVIGQDGTIYGGYNKLRAINPENGSVKWSFDPGEDATIRAGNPCISADGIIIFATHIGETDGGELIAVNPDGTERWRIMLASIWIWSAPAIGSDGTIYVGSNNDKEQSGAWGYLHAIGELDPNAPSGPEIDGPKKIKPDVEYEYNFKAISPVGKDSYYWIEWGDNKREKWIGPYSSGDQITVTHKWSWEGTFTIKARSKDTDNLWSPWSEFEMEVTASAPTKPIIEGPASGKKGVLYDYSFMSTHPDEQEIYYYVDWGDHTNTGWFGPFNSGAEVLKSHKWNLGRTYVIRSKAKDIHDGESEWSDFEVSIPRNKVTFNSLYFQFLELFPLLERLLNILR